MQMAMGVRGVGPVISLRLSFLALPAVWFESLLVSILSVE